MIIKQVKDMTINEIKELIHNYELQEDELFIEEKRYLNELKRELKERGIK